MSDLQKFIDKVYQDEGAKREFKKIDAFIKHIIKLYKDKAGQVIVEFPIDDYKVKDDVLFIGTMNVDGHDVEVCWDGEGDTPMFCGFVKDVPCAHTQGETIEELKDNIVEVIELCQDV